MTKNDIGQILDRICSGIASKAERSDARDELYDHIMNHYEKNIACGMAEEEACSEAVKMLGDTDIISRNLKAVHNATRARRLLVLKIAIVLLVVVLVFGPWVLLFTSISDRPTVNKVTDVDMYSQITGNQHYSEDGHVAMTALETVKMPIFPEKINDKNRVRKFMDLTYRYLGAESEICCLVIDYSESDFNSESEYLKVFNRNEAYKTAYEVDRAKEGYGIITIYGDSRNLMYALSDNKHPGRIIYMYFKFGTNDLPSRFVKDINKDYLLEGFTGKQSYFAIKKETHLLRYPPQLSITDFSLSNTFFVRPYSSEWIYTYHLDLENADYPLDESFDESGVINLTDGELEVYKQDYEHKTTVGFMYEPSLIHGIMTNVETGETVDWDFEVTKYLPEGEWKCTVEAVWEGEYYGGTAVYKFHFINRK